jgi:hypothetical protein
MAERAQSGSRKLEDYALAQFRDKAWSDVLRKLEADIESAAQSGRRELESALVCDHGRVRVGDSCKTPSVFEIDSY